MNKNAIIVTIISVVVIIGFLFMAYNLTNTSPSSTTYKENQTLISSDHIKWSAEKKNLLIEYSDLQCPACKAFHDTIKNQIEKSKDGAEIMKKITFVYRHFPLDQHKYARTAAYAAEAAANQGKYYEMQDLLFEAQTTWSTSNNPQEEFIKMAQKLNLDIEKFKKDMDSKEVKEIVEKNRQLGLQSQVNATPTFYLNGKKLDNIASFAEFINLLKQTP